MASSTKIKTTLDLSQFCTGSEDRDDFTECDVAIDVEYDLCDGDIDWHIDEFRFDAFAPAALPKRLTDRKDPAFIALRDLVDGNRIDEKLAENFDWATESDTGFSYAKGWAF